MFRLIDCLMFNVPFDKVSLTWRRQHFRRRAAKCLPVHEKIKWRKVMSTKATESVEPPAGLEPAIPGLGGRSLIHWATEAVYSGSDMIAYWLWYSF